MSPLIVALILLLAGLALIFLELFIPSAGLLSVLAIVSLISSVVWAYLKCGAYVGTGFFAAVAVIVPVFVSMALKWWPHTPIGRWVMLAPPTEAETSSVNLEQRDHLVGQRGVAQSAILPGGVAVIDNHQYDVVSDGTVIEKGDCVEVIEVDGTRIIVTLCSSEELNKQENKSRFEADPLSQPIESLGIDPLDDPLS